MIKAKRKTVLVENSRKVSSPVWSVTLLSPGFTVYRGVERSDRASRTTLESSYLPFIPMTLCKFEWLVASWGHCFTAHSLFLRAALPVIFPPVPGGKASLLLSTQGRHCRWMLSWLLARVLHALQPISLNAPFLGKEEENALLSLPKITGLSLPSPKQILMPK